MARLRQRQKEQIVQQVLRRVSPSAGGSAAQTPFASGGAAPPGGVGTAAGGYDTAVDRDALITLVNNIRTALINNGIMS